MDIPKSFRPEKNLDQYVEDVVKERVINDLLENCQKFLSIIKTGKGGHLTYHYSLVEEQDDWFMYKEAEGLAEGIRYRIDHLKKLSPKITVKENADNYLGYYLSALINKVVEEGDELTLKLHKDSRLHGIGYGINNITLILDGHVGDCVGYDMKSGKLHVKGHAGDHAGEGMEKGILIIRGDTGEDTGECSEKEAIIKVYGKIGSISKAKKGHFGCEGRIYHKNKLIWPK